MNWRGFLPKWAWRFFQMAGYLFGFVAFIFTVLTIPEDFKTTVLGTVLSEGVPWFVLFVAAGMFFAIALVGRTAIAPARTSDGLSPPEGESVVGSKAAIEAFAHAQQIESLKASLSERRDIADDLLVERDTAQLKIEHLDRELKIQQMDSQAAMAELHDEVLELKQQIPAPPAVVPPPTPSETVAIDDLRVAFNSLGTHASRAALNLLDSINDALRGTNPLATLLDQERNPANKAHNRMERLLADDSDAAFGEVIGGFAEWFHRYIRVVRWMHLAAGDPQFKKGSLVLYSDWKQAHDDFQREMTKILHRADLAPLRDSISHDTGWAIRFGDDTFGFDADNQAVIES